MKWILVVPKNKEKRKVNLKVKKEVKEIEINIY